MAGVPSGGRPAPRLNVAAAESGCGSWAPVGTRDRRDNQKQELGHREREMSADHSAHLIIRMGRVRQWLDAVKWSRPINVRRRLATGM